MQDSNVISLIFPVILKQSLFHSALLKMFANISDSFNSTKTKNLPFTLHILTSLHEEISRKKKKIFLEQALCQNKCKK